MRYLWIRKYLKLQKKLKKPALRQLRKKLLKLRGKKSKNESSEVADPGIVIIDDDIKIDKQC